MAATRIPRYWTVYRIYCLCENLAKVVFTDRQTATNNRPVTYYILQSNSPSALINSICEHAFFINLTHRRASITLHGWIKVKLRTQSSTVCILLVLINFTKSRFNHLVRRTNKHTVISRPINYNGKIAIFSLSISVYPCRHQERPNMVLQDLVWLCRYA